ncbi:c-type cytochrome [Roseibacterium sp. SDUM158017]|uniref:c-type cytochrome n=1 Tax=Roseicyclus salinarum TaxID=3036773 RepID=UPI002414DC77|nr:c-type cytochrome [Roseibacterium sp. SDUM158017]MDG4649376.1 c-type cytochrome [Roseibacterium sp. SDUM158017]
MRIPAFAIAACSLAGGASAQGDPERGAILFRPCAACHMIGEGAINRIGPHLNGIVGRPLGGAEGYGYSQALLDRSAEVGAWSEAALDSFLANPGGFIPGTSMVFRGIRSSDDRSDLIAYLVEEGGGADPGGDEGPSPEVAAILEIEGDLAYGQYLSSECTSCHVGAGGEGIPSVRGLPRQVFVSALEAYRSGAREHQVMNTLAARLGDEEIAALAAYFGSTAD